MSESNANSIYGNYTTLAVPMFTLVTSVLAPISTSFMPRLSESSLKGDKKKFSESFGQIFLITVLISVPASLAMFFYSFDLLDVLFSVQSSALGAELLICLSLGVCLLSMLTVVNTALESKGRIFSTVISLLVGAAVKIIVSYALIGSSYGILGAPIGSVFSYFVSLIISIFALELTGVKTRAFRTCISLYLIGTLAFYFPYEFIYRRGFFASSFSSMLISLALSFALYVTLLIIVYIFLLRKSVLKINKKAY